MKKYAFRIATFCLILVSLLIAAFAAGDASDPLISLSFLNGSYSTTVEGKIDERLNASDQTLLGSVSQPPESSGSNQPSVSGNCAESWAETRLKYGDTLSGNAGLNVLPLAGSVRVSFPAGAVVDVTTGQTVASGTQLITDHRYMVAEDTAASFTVTSKTAVVDYMGYYAFSLSSAVDYNAMASALKTMHLFKGSFTGYGSGYDLEFVPTRLQSLIMFLRVLGEEEAALQYTGTTPFTDIHAGTDAAKYVGYAYEKGYTNGYTETLWKPAQPVNVYQYTEFMLRALKYSSTANTNLADTLERAVSSGVLTSGEAAALKGSTFLRADLVYISYYALDATVSGSSGTLRDVLIAKGVFSAAESRSAKALVPGKRIV